jgi:YggT family protein
MRDFMQLFRIVHALFSFYFILLSVAIISSWFPETQDFRIIQLIRRCTDPYLDLFRRYIPPLGFLDISPIIAFLALQFLERLVIGIIFS